MKVYELMKLLGQIPADKDVVVAGNKWDDMRGVSEVTDWGDPESPSIGIIGDGPDAADGLEPVVPHKSKKKK